MTNVIMMMMSMVKIMVIMVMSTHAVGDLLGVHVVSPGELSLVAAPSGHLAIYDNDHEYREIMRMMTEIINIVIIMMMMI